MLKGKTVIITGASRGIGKCIAEMMAQNGARVYANARNEGSIDSWAQEISNLDCGTIVPFYCDLVEVDKIKEILQKIWKEAGRIDVLVNNAGTALMGDMETFPEEIFRKHAELMMYAPVRLTNLCIPHFKKNGWGSVVNTSSIFGKQPGGLISYDVIKAADIMITKDYSNYCAAFNVNVNAVCPGPVDTPLWYAEGQLGDQLAGATGMSKEDAIAWFAKTNIPMGRYATPEEIANAIVFLSSEPAHYITGVSINVDGGMVKSFI